MIDQTPKEGILEKRLLAWGHDPSTGEQFHGNCTLQYQYQYHICILDSIAPEPNIVADPNYSVIGKNRPGWQYGANISGGVSSFSYFLSGNYSSQTGALTLGPAVVASLKQQLGTASLQAVRNPNTVRDMGGFATVSADINTKTNATLSMGYTQTTHQQADITNYQSQIINGLQPGDDSLRPLNNFDPYSALTTTEDQSSRTTLSATGTYRPFDWLSGMVTFGLDLMPSITHMLLPAGEAASYDEGYASDRHRSNVGRTMTLNATALAHPGMLSFRSTLGAQYAYSHLDGLDANGNGLAPGSNSLQTARSISFEKIWDERASLGTYGEEVVGVRDRLFLTGSLRIDGSTSFGDAYHPTPYPKLGVSWIASDEPFLARVPGLSELRFRYSYGAASRYPTSGMKLGTQSGYPVLVDGSMQTIFFRNALGNPDIRPERTREAEYGADLTLFSNLRVDLTWYRRRTMDQLQPLQQNSIGLPPLWVNLGLITGHGHEATVSATVLNRPNIQADLLFTYSYHTTKVLDLGAVPQFRGTDGAYVVGYPIGAAFSPGGPIIGVADTVGGVADGIVFPEEVIHGTPQSYQGVLVPPRVAVLTPKVDLFGGLIRVSTAFDRQTGAVLRNYYTQYCSRGLCRGAFDKTAPLMEQALAYDEGDQFQSADFTRWRELSMTFAIPRRFTRFDRLHLNLSQVSFSVQGRNLKLWTPFATDPESRDEVSGFSSYSDGIPQTRTWSFRFDINP